MGGSGPGGFLQFFGGSPIFWRSPIFQRGGSPNFWGVSNFLWGVHQIFWGSPIFRGGLHQDTVNVRPVRILLECILVFEKLVNY